VSTAVVLLGPPGAGKGTQAKHIERRFGLVHISTGDMLRAAVAEGSELGRRAEGYMKRGELVPDELIIEMILERIARPDCGKGYMLDGFPRTLAQAEALDASLAERGGRIDLAILFTCDPEAIVERMSGRRVCPTCGAVFHLAHNPPAKPGVCDRDGTPLVLRPDDRPEVVRKRLEVYEENTAPVAEFYRKRGVLAEVDASRPIPEVTAAVDRLLEAVTRDS